MHNKILQALLLSLCLLLSCLPAQVDSSCPLKYLEQPPDQLNCNPYPREELLLECTISIQSQFLHLHGLSPSTLELHWFHSQHTPEAGEMQVVATYQEEREIVTDQAAYEGEQTALAITQLKDLQENVNIIEQTLPIGSGVQVRSRLELYRLTESDMGAYWCSIHFNYTKEPLSKTLVAGSDSVLLEHPRDYAYREQCITNIAQSKQENKCALSSSTTALPQVDSKITPNHGVTATTPLSLEEQTTLESDKKDEGKGHILKEFYIALGILVAFGSIIAVLVLVVVCTCLQYRKILNAKQTLRGDKEAVILQSLPPSDYLIPVPSIAQTSGNVTLASIQPTNSGVDNPIYVSTLHTRKQFTSRWLQQQQDQPQQQEPNEVQLQVPRRSEIFLHSYETIMSDDYEDMTGTKYDPMLMRKNDAYIYSSTLSRTLPIKTQLE